MDLKTFRAKLKEAQAKHTKEVLEGKSDFNVFKALGVEYKENYHSAFLAYLLDDEEAHYQNLFIKKFLQKLRKEKSLKGCLPRLNHKDINLVQTEYATSKNRRIDLLIGFRDDFYILLENKVYAKDQDRQIRDYIEDLLKGNREEGRRKAKDLLTIYLTPHENNPSKRSFGLRANAQWEIDGNKIVDSKKNKKSLYFKMDYQWVKDWLTACLNELKDISKEKVDSQTKGDKGLYKITFCLEQYLEILEDIVSYGEIREENPILDLICHDENQQYAFKIHENEEDRQYKIIDDVWEGFEEHIVKDFFNQFESYMNDNKVCLADKRERWYVNQTQRDNFNTMDQDRLHFFPNRYYYENYWVGFDVFYNKPNYGHPSVNLMLHFADDHDLQDRNVDETYNQIKSEILEELESIVCKTNSKNYRKFWIIYWKENFLGLKEGENLVSWIMKRKIKLAHYSIDERNKAIIEEFLDKMKVFTMDQDIVKTYKTIVEIADKKHEDFEQKINSDD